MGFVFQVLPAASAERGGENVELPLLVSGVRLREGAEAALEALEQVRLAERANHRRQSFREGTAANDDCASPGEPAGAGMGDEPTGDLDLETANEIMDVLVDLNREQGLTFILVTHDRGIGARCERIMWMRDGR